MAEKSLLYNGSFVDAHERFQLPTVNPDLSLYLDVTSLSGYGLILTLRDPLGSVAWTETITGQTGAEIEIEHRRW